MSANRKSASSGRSAGMNKPAYLDNFLLIAFDAVIAFDSQNKITFLNPAAEQLYGWPAREALGKRPSELFWPVRSPEAQEEVSAGSLKLAQGETIQGEYEALCKDGSSLWVEYSVRATFDEKGEISGYVSVYRDITPRKRADEDIRRLNSELQARLDELNTLLNVLPAGVWIGNEDVSVLTGNLAAYQMLGLEQGINASLTTAQPQIPPGLQIFVNGEPVAPENAPMQQVARSGEPLYNLEHEFFFSDGTRKAVLANIVPLFDEQKKIRKIIGAYTDLTQYKQLLNQIQLISRMPAENPNPVLRLTSDGKILYANPASASLLESWKSEAGQTAPVELETQLAEVFTSGTRKEIEIEHGGKTFAFSLVPVTEAGYINLYGTDISERKAAEEQRKQLLQREQEQRARADQATLEAGRAQARAQKELEDRKLAEAALGAWTDSPLAEEERPKWLRYTLAAVATVIAVLIRQLLDPVLGDFILLTPVYGAVAYSVWYGGMGPALFSAIAGYAAMALFFMEPDYGRALDPRNLVGFALFLISSGIVISLGDAMRRAQRHAHQSARVAVERQRQAEFRLAEQKRAEEALRESERKFSLIYNNLPFAATLATPQDAAVVDVNDEFEKMFGYTKAEVIGKTALELGISRDVPRRAELFEQLRQRGSARDVEIELFNKAGEKRDFLINADFVTMESEKYLLTTMHDITERKRIDGALAEFARQQHALYQFVDQLHRMNTQEDVLNAALDAIIRALRCDRASILLFDKSNTMRFVAWQGLSDEYRTATDGHSPWKWDEFNPEPICVEDLDATDFSDSLRAVIKGEGIASLAFIPLVVDGKLIGKFMTYYNAPHVFEQDEVELSLTLARQLAFSIDRKRTEKALARERELLARLFETMPVMVSLYDFESETMRLNAQLERSLGWKSEEVTVRSLLDAIYPDPEYQKYVLQRMAQAGKDEWVEVQVQARDGRKLDSLWANVSLFDDRQQPIVGIGIGIDITERKRAELKLRESEERYRTIVDTANEGIWYVDLNAETLYLNEPMARLLGYSVDEVIGHKVQEFCFEEDIPSAQARIASNYQGAYERFDFRFRRKDGGEVRVLASTSPVRDATGQIAGALGMFADVTERRRAEEALRISEDRLRLAVSAANIGIWDIDLVARERTWSKEGKAIYGLQPDDFLDFERQLALTHPDDRVIVYGMVTAFRDLGTLKQLNLEHRIIRPDGALRWVDVRGEAIYAEGRELPVRLIGTIVDITERKQAEQALRESEQRFRTLANAMPSIVWTAAPDGTITYANDQWFRYTGTTPEENARGWPELALHPDDYDRCVREWNHALETVPDEYLIEVRNRRYDGEYRWFQTRAVPARDASGKAIAWYGVTTDIHERIESAERLTLLAEISEHIRNMEDPNELLFAVSKAVGNHLQARRCLFNEIDLERDIEIVHRDYCRGVESVAGIHKVTDYSSVTSAEMASGKTVVNHDSRTDPRTAADYERSYRAYGERAYVTVPLMRENRWVASLWLSDDMPRQWKQEDVSLLETIAERTWNAVERLRIAEELSAREAELETILNRTPFMLTRCTRDLHYRFVSRAYAEMLGRKPEEVAGQPIVEIMGEGAFQIITPFVEQVLQGKTVEYEEEVPFKGVEARFLHVIYTPDWDEDRNVIGWFASIIDITERKQMEEALRVENERFMRFVDSNIVGILIANGEGKVKLANDYYLGLLGVSREDLMDGNVDWRKFTPPEWLPADEKALRELSERGTCEPYEKEYVRADGTRVPVYIVDAMLPGPGGEIAAFVLDITERKRSEDALRESEARLAMELADTKQLQNISSLLIHEDDVDLLYEEIINAAIHLMHSDMGSMQMLYPENNQLFLLAWKGFDPASAAFWEWVSIDSNSTCGVALRTSERVVVPDIETSDFMAGTPDLDAYRLSGIRAVQTTPLISRRGHIVGMISTHWREPHHPSERELRMLDVLARQATDLIERKRAEEALRSSEALYRTIARSIPGGGVYVVDKDMRYLVAEGPVTEAFGLSREILEGHTVSEVFSGVQRERMIDRLTRNFAGETLNYETEYKGRVFWTQQAPLKDSLGQAIILTIEITERKRAEQALRNSEERMRLAIEANRMVAWEWNPDIDRVTASDNFADIYGLPEVSTAADGFALIWPEDLPAHREKVDLVTRQGGEYRSEFRITRPADGRVLWMEERASALTDDEGRITRLVGVVTDITDRKQAEEALRQSEERFVQFMEHLPGLAWIKDTQGRYVYANASAEKAFGMPREKLYGLVDEEVFPREVAAQFRGNDERALAERQGIQVVETFKQDDGILHYSLVSKFPIPNPDGTTMMIGGTAIDITDRKKAEDALRIRARQQEIVASLGELALRERNLQKIFDEATVMIAEALKVKYAKVLELLPTGDMLLLRSGVGWNPGLVGWATIDASPESQAGYTLRSAVPLVVQDLREERRFIGSSLLHEHNVVSGMTCIIPGPDRTPWGVLGAHSGQPMFFRPDDISFLVSVANILGDAIHRDRAEDELRAHQEELQVLNETLEMRVKEQTEEVRKLASDLTKAEQRERHRISHILHDDFQQRIYAIQMQMAFLYDGTALEDEGMRKELAEIKEQMEALLLMTRHLSIDMSPPILSNEGLAQAIGWLASQMQEQYGLEVHLQAKESFAITDEDLQVLLFTCVRELLFNVVKHANTSVAWVNLLRLGPNLRIEIKDAGKGFEVTTHLQQEGRKAAQGEADLKPSFGLPTIRHRINLLGGRMEIQSAPGAGTQITIIVPVFEDKQKKAKTDGS